MVVLNVVLNNLPIYMLSFFKDPRFIFDGIIKLYRAFLWGGGDVNRKNNRVSWDRVYMANEDGGLRVKHYENFNNAMISKWCWICLTEPNSI